jgi:hypothetical protein
MPTYWTTKDGKQIDVMEMDINHLRNVVKLFITHLERLKAIKVSQEMRHAVKPRPFKLNGEIAQSMIDDELAAEYEDEYD